MSQDKLVRKRKGRSLHQEPKMARRNDEVSQVDGYGDNEAVEKDRASTFIKNMKINDFSLARRPISVGSSSSSSLNEESGSGVVDLTVDLTVDSDVEELAVVDLTSPSPKKPLSRDGSDNKEKSDSRSFTTSATDDDVIIISSPCLPLGSSSVPHSVSPSSSTSDRYSSISCPVCMETQTAFSTSSRFLVATNCGHLFCNECLRKSIALMHKCPTCSRKLSLKQYHRIYL